MPRYQVIKYTRRRHGWPWRRYWSPEHEVVCETDDLRGAIDTAIEWGMWDDTVIFVRDTDNGRRVYEKMSPSMRGDTPLRG